MEQTREPSTAALEACRCGDRAALDAVLRVQIPSLERLLLRLVGPGPDAEDLLQTVLMNAVRGFPQFRGEASLRTWISRIAVQVVRDHLRSPARRRTVLELVEPEADAPRPDRVASDRECLERLYHHLASITPKKRIAFVLHVMEGHSIDEVAALTGASRAATKSRVFWARRALMSRAARDPALRSLAGVEMEVRS